MGWGNKSLFSLSYKNKWTRTQKQSQPPLAGEWVGESIGNNSKDRWHNLSSICGTQLFKDYHGTKNVWVIKSINFHDS